MIHKVSQDLHKFRGLGEGLLVSVYPDKMEPTLANMGALLSL